MGVTIVRTPFTRRRVLALLAGAATVLGGAKLAVRSAAGPGGGGETAGVGTVGLGEAPLPAAGRRPALTVAVPTGGQYGRTNEQLRGAIERALPAVAQEAGGRFQLAMVELALPTRSEERRVGKA